MTGIAFADGAFGEYSGDVKELLWYLQHSRLARGGIIALSKEFCYRNSELIKSEIQDKKGNNGDHKIEQTLSLKKLFMSTNSYKE